MSSYKARIVLTNLTTLLQAGLRRPDRQVGRAGYRTMELSLVGTVLVIDSDRVTSYWL